MKPTPTPTPTPNATPLTRAFGQDAANPPWKLPPPLFDARCRACWFTAALLVLVVASFVSLNLDWAAFASMDAARSMGRFVAEFFPPDLSPIFLGKVVWAAWETLAMSALGTAIAALLGLALADCQAKTRPGCEAPRVGCSMHCAPFLSWCGPLCC